MALSPNQPNDSIDNIALAIRELIVEELPETWAIARAVAVVGNQESGLTYSQYKRESNEGEWLSFDTDYRMYVAFDALRQQLHTLLGEPWSRAQATLLPNGSLIFSFAYHNTEKLAKV